MERKLSRRHLNRAGLAAGVVAGSLAVAGPAFAQNAATPTDDTGLSTGTPAATPEAAGPAIPPEISDVETNWAVEGGNLHQTREAKGSNISSETVADLGYAWSMPVSVSAPFGALTGNPIVAGDILYIQDAKSNIYAVDKTTGESRWTNTYNDDVPSGGPNGIAVGYGLAVFPLGGAGDVVAVKADTGEEVWRTNIRGPLGEGITMAPLIYDNTVYVSTIPGSPDEFYKGGQRGFIYALDARDGHVVWYFDTTTDNLWGNGRVNSGGGLWHPPAVDADGNLYVGIANAAPFPGTKEFPGASSRPGDNDYANALMRINPDTAGYDWYINLKPHDLFDHDNQLSPILATITIDGTETPVVFSSGKHGFVVAANSETGEELWRTPVGEHNENEFLSELGADEEITVIPGFIGGVETPIAFANGVIFAPVLNVPFTVNGVEGTGDIFGGTSELVALDGATGEILWSTPVPTMVLGGATIANDIVFTGGLDGLVRGFRVDDGTQIFAYQAAAGINTSFAISGDFLYVPAGAPLVPSPDSIDTGAEPATELIALKLGGEVRAAPGSSPEASPAS
ncbi:MAG TPA: PQQ-binding-like beta-propeller repeat protein [Thermomicrobiales bacterium]|nr:PQQ-binding-like beta-propeller repeat protein [Thermomicrobiales bacterium]